MKKESIKISWWSCHGLFCHEGHIKQAVAFLNFVQLAPKLQSKKHVIIIIVQTLSEDIELLKCLPDIIWRMCE